jgi:DNA (cytosine-5)-methyltransferase 1
LHPYENRRISVREALRIQGVPDSYALPPQVSKTKKFKMIGNGVPVPLANAVANTLRTFIEDNKIIK